MFEEKSKTSLGQMIERNITFAVGELKTTSERMGFIRHGLQDPDDSAGAMACLYLIETHLDDVILDIKDNIEKVIELDALATGQGLFVPRTGYEEEAIEALKRAQETDAARNLLFDFSLSRAICKTIIRAEQAFQGRLQNPMTENESISAAVIEAVGEEGQEVEDHA